MKSGNRDKGWTENEPGARMLFRHIALLASAAMARFHLRHLLKVVGGKSETRTRARHKEREEAVTRERLCDFPSIVMEDGMSEMILEESQKPNGDIVQTVQRADGTEYQREYAYTCAICGAPGDRPFPTWAISCMRKECREGEITDRD